MNWAAIRQDFPALATLARGKPLAYLDNAATSQKPAAVIERMRRYWVEENANVHRGVHYRSQLATAAYEGTRVKVQRFLNANSVNEIVFTKGCTEAINLVAHGLAAKGIIRSGSSVLVSTLEHHSNIVPWQLVAERVGAHVLPIPVSDAGELDLDAYRAMFQSAEVAVVAVGHVSNALGTINPVKEIARVAQEQGALVVVDGAQAGPHIAIDVQDLGADFYTLSCHKMYAPTGVGVLYGKLALLNSLPPYQGGGDMIRTVSFDGSTFADSPARFEAGTPNIAGVVGLGETIDYLTCLAGGPVDSRESLVEAMAAVAKREDELYNRTRAEIADIPGINVYGDVPHKASVLSFTTDWAHPHDIGTVLDSHGVAVRTGHHCCQPLMTRYAIAATVRASLSFYNDEADISAFGKAMHVAREMFK